MVPSSTATLSEEMVIQRTKTASIGCSVVPAPVVTPVNNSKDGVLLIGQFVLCNYPSASTFDLDTGELGTYDVLPFYDWELENYKSETDIMLYMVGFQLSDQWIYGLQEINGAQVDAPYNNDPSYEDCRFFATRDKNGFFIDGKEEKVGCVVTNQGRVAMIRVESIDRYGWGSIELFFKTWSKLDK